MTLHITFNQLKAVMSKRIGQPGMPSRAALPNANTALGKFCRAVTTDMNARVGETLRERFAESVQLFREQLERAGYQRESINNKISLINCWERLVRALDHEGASEDGSITQFQALLGELYNTRADMRRIAQRAGVSWRVLRNWKNGSIPRTESDDALRRIAIACGLESDALIKLLPVAVGRKVAPSVPVIEIPGRKQRGQLANSPYLLKPHEIENLNPTLLQEWRGLFTHKVRVSEVSTDGNGKAKPSIRDRIRIAKEQKPKERGKTWRTRPIEDYAPSYKESWIHTIGGLIAPSAEKSFKDVTEFLGWLRLPPEEGGRGIPVEKLSMGMLVDETLVDAFLEWHAVRVDAVNSGTTNWIASTRSYTRPETGYLWCSDAIGLRNGFDKDTWRARCAKANACLALRLGQYSSIKEPSRGIELQLKPLLDLPRPLLGFRDAINKYAKECRLSDHQRATQSRDLALLSVSISNPLRLTNLRLLTYKPDNTGHFRKTGTGSGWELFVPKEEFKNICGAAKDKDYRMPLSQLAAYYLEAYLTKWWSYFGGPGKRNLVFVPKGSPDKVWKHLPAQYASATKKILRPLGCPSIRPHSSRYLVGTAILMASLGNVELAAQALHDTTSTVEKHYKKILDSFKARGIEALVGQDLSLDEDAVGLVIIPDAASFTKRLPGRVSA